MLAGRWRDRLRDLRYLTSALRSDATPLRRRLFIVHSFNETGKAPMPRSEELNQRLREESQERILVAALRVFADHGYGGASMRMIAQEADISPGLIYAYFPGKEALRDAIFARSMNDVRASFIAADAEPVAQRRLERLLQHFVLDPKKYPLNRVIARLLERYSAASS
jgi:AcrR family transcriptional regulator